MKELIAITTILCFSANEGMSATLYAEVLEGLRRNDLQFQSDATIYPAPGFLDFFTARSYIQISNELGLNRISVEEDIPVRVVLLGDRNDWWMIEFLERDQKYYLRRTTWQLNRNSLEGIKIGSKQINELEVSKDIVATFARLSALIVMEGEYSIDYINHMEDLGATSDLFLSFYGIMSAYIPNPVRESAELKPFRVWESLYLAFVDGENIESRIADARNVAAEFMLNNFVRVSDR